MAEQWVEISLGIAGWYLTSFGTLLLNKYLLGSLHIQPSTLAVVQMVSTAIYGALKTVRCGAMLHSLLYEVWPAVRRKLGGTAKIASEGAEDLEDPKDGPKPAVVRSWQRGLAQMGFVGAMRFSTVVLGLVSLKHIAASFTETIKASAPFFTVIIAFLMLGERTSLKVVVSLVPLALGLVMTSYTELSFNIIGFSAAVATNVIECVQNVFSKRLLAKDYTASQLQFYTSLTALVLQAPLFLWSLEMPGKVVGDNSTHATVFPQAFWPQLGERHRMCTDHGSEVAEDQHECQFRAATQGTAYYQYCADLQMCAVLETCDTSIEGSLHDWAIYARPEDAEDDQQADFEWNSSTIALLWIDGVLYHLQSVVAYVVMSYLSPVTVSVVNTLKRALLIWISILVFHNKVTAGAAGGTVICLLGALCYNVARQQQPQAAPAASSDIAKSSTLATKRKDNR